MQNIKTCTKCPLFQNNPQYCTPITSYGKGTNLFIDDQPDKYTLLGEKPYGFRYDLINKICTDLNVEFHYTYLIRCLGKTSKEKILTCLPWIFEEITHIQPNIIFTLGKTRQYIKHDTIKIVNLKSPVYILRNGTKELKLYIETIKQYVT